MIALSTIKKALKIDYDTDDSDILRLRDAAISFFSDYTGLSLTTDVHTQYLDYWMLTRLTGAPFVEISSITYTDTDGNQQTYSNTDYFLIYKEYPSVFINFYEYPSLKEGTEIVITYKAGYAEIPANITQAIIAICGAWYNNPEATSPITLTEVPLSAKFILDNLKVKGDLS